MKIPTHISFTVLSRMCGSHVLLCWVGFVRFIGCVGTIAYERGTYYTMLGIPDGAASDISINTVDCFSRQIKSRKFQGVPRTFGSFPEFGSLSYMFASGFWIWLLLATGFDILSEASSQD
jgi:hypothetical protein